MPTAISQIGWYDWAGILLLAVLALLQRRARRAGAFWQICWAFPGTILHELSHLLVAAATGGRPVGFSIIPRRDHASPTRRRWVVGSVRISNPGIISALPSGLAPLTLLGVAWYVFLHWGAWFPRDLSHTALKYGAVYLLSYGALPSGKDLEVAFSKPLGVALYGAVAAGAWMTLR